MPLIRTIQVNDTAKIGIWEITEQESYFLTFVFPQKQIKHPYKRLQHLAGRRLLKALIPNFPLEKVGFNACGKPMLTDGSCYFSISHSANYAVAIVSDEWEVGIDIERIHPKIINVIPRILSPAEQSGIPNDLVGYTLSWSAKEAVFKWAGENRIDAKKHIKLSPFSLQKEGTFEALYTKEERKEKLEMHYLRNEEFVLVWTAEKIK